MDKFDIRDYILKNRNTLFEQALKRKKLREREESKDEETSDESSTEPTASKPEKTGDLKTDIYKKLINIWVDAKTLGDEKFLTQIDNTIIYYTKNNILDDRDIIPKNVQD